MLFTCFSQALKRLTLGRATVTLRSGGPDGNYSSRTQSHAKEGSKPGIWCEVA